MEPFKLKELPIEYNIDKELLKLLSEANEKYGEYKSYLKNSSINQHDADEAEVYNFVNESNI